MTEGRVYRRSRMSSSFDNALSEFVYKRTYAKWDPEKGRRENWDETVNRTIDFLFAGKGVDSEVVEEIRGLMSSVDVLPSMRALMCAGAPAERDNVCLYNCSSLPIDNLKAFAEVLQVLMQGTGAGYSVERRFVSKLPVVQRDLGIVLPYVVDDSTEGWANSVYHTIVANHKGIYFDHDYSLVRPKGARLRTKGGRASGPEPLKRVLDFIQMTCRRAQGRKLSSLDAHDILCMEAEIVMVGGFRRASLISFSDVEDQEMASCKDFTKGDVPVHRYMANNSAFYEHKPTKDVFWREWNALAMSGSGERGFSINNWGRKATARAGKLLRSNPCVTGDTLVRTPAGDFRIDSLVGKKSDLVVDTRFGAGSIGSTTDVGAWSNGVKDVYLLKLNRHGYALKLTLDHRVMTERGWVHAGALLMGDGVHVVSPLGLQGVAGIESLEYVGPEEVFDLTETSTHSFIANGVVVHNCHEIGLEYTESTDSWTGAGGGGEVCNLSAVVVRSQDTKDSLRRKVVAATILGVVQASFTEFPHLRPAWAETCNRNRLLGVDITGQCDNPALTRDTRFLTELNALALKTADEYASLLGINPPVAVTCGKPSGNSSQLANCASGFHPRYSHYYIRRVRIDGKDPLFALIRDQGVPVHKETGQEHLPDDDVSVWVAEFPVAAPEGAMTRHDETALDQCGRYLEIMRSWCSERGHNQSATIYVRDPEWIPVGEWLWEHWEEVTGLSFLPFAKEDIKYRLTPYEEITKEQYDDMVSKFPAIDFSLLPVYEVDDMGEQTQSLSCVSGVCEL